MPRNRSEKLGRVTREAGEPIQGSITDGVGPVESQHSKLEIPTELGSAYLLTTGSHCSQVGPWVVNSLLLPGFHKCQEPK